MLQVQENMFRIGQTELVVRSAGNNKCLCKVKNPTHIEDMENLYRMAAAVTKYFAAHGISTIVERGIVWNRDLLN